MNNKQPATTTDSEKEALRAKRSERARRAATPEAKARRAEEREARKKAAAATARLQKRRRAALIELHADLNKASRAGLIFGATTAASLLGITSKSLKAMIRPTEYAENPHYSSGPKVALYDPIVLVRLSSSKKLQAARQRVAQASQAKVLKGQLRRKMFETRYSSWEAALEEACEALFDLNRYARASKCSETHREEILNLKSSVIDLLLVHRYDFERGSVVRTQYFEEKECWGCQGAGCPRCEFTGLYDEGGTAEYWYAALGFRVGSRIFRWLTPLDYASKAVRAAVAEMPGRDWEESEFTAGYDGRPTRKFAEAKALIRWVLDTAPTPPADIMSDEDDNDVREQGPTVLRTTISQFPSHRH